MAPNTEQERFDFKEKVVLKDSDVGSLEEELDMGLGKPDGPVQNAPDQEDKPVLGTDAKEYYGTKRIWAWPAEKEGKPGYSVRYSDSYLSWSPKDIFEEVYQSTIAMTFGHAVDAMKAGHKLSRKSLDWQRVFVFLVQGSRFKVNRAPLLGIFEEGTRINYHEHIDVKNADGTIATWSPSNADVLANDWKII